MKKPQLIAPVAGPLSSVAALLAALGSSSADAANFNVTNKNDAGPGSLRDAVAQANATTGSHNIHFDPKLKGVITLKTGEMDITRELIIQGPGAKVLAISGNHASRIFDIANSAADVAIRGLTLTRGRTTGGTIDDSGGAVRSFAMLSFTDCVVTGNATTGSIARGGGVNVYGASLTLNNSTVSGNSTSGFGAEGGGVYVYGGSLTLNDSTVSGNRTAGTNAYGGGVRVESGGAMLTGSTISGNSTTGDTGRGGGISALNSPITLIDSTVSGNSTSAINASGGGIYSNAGNIVLTNSTLSGNSTAGKYGFGGGLRTDGDVTVTNSTVSGNSTAGATSGGGGLSVSDGNISLRGSAVFNNSTTGADSGGSAVFLQMGDLVMTNSTVSGNFSTGPTAGGVISAVYVVSGGNATITNSTIALNTSVNGTADGVYVAGTFTADNSIIAQGGGSDVACGTTIDAGSNNRATDASCGMAANVTLTTLPALNLGGLADNGGPTKTHALLPGSDAIDAGLNTICDDAPPGTNNQDQRGVARFINGDCDVGAYELNPAEPSLACPLTPNTGCVSLPAASLTVKRGKMPKLSFTASGSTVGDTGLFGNPKTGTGNLLCVYQQEVLDSQYRVPSPLSSLLWKFDAAKGIATYSEKLGLFDGVTNVKQTPGAKAKLSWTVKGDSTLEVRQPATLPVQVQNQNTEGSCAESLFDQPGHITKNDGTTLSLKRKAP